MTGEEGKPRTQHGRRYHHGDLKGALIAAAGEMLERDGPEAISFRAVARATGVSQTAPYNHFQSKEDLLATVAGTGFRDLEAAQIAAAGAAPPGEARIAALGRDYIRCALARPQLYRLMFGVGVSDWYAHPEVLAARNASFRPIQAALADHLATGGKAAPEAVETAAIAAWALVHGLSMLLIDRSLDPTKKVGGQAEDLITRTMALFASGLRPAGSMIASR